MTTARLWAPASPPIRATRGINAARTVNCSRIPLNRLIATTTTDEITTSKEIHGSLLRIERGTGVCTVSSAPAPTATAKSSLASSCTTSSAASVVTIPSSRRELSTTGRPKR